MQHEIQYPWGKDTPNIKVVTWKTKELGGAFHSLGAAEERERVIAIFRLDFLALDLDDDDKIVSNCSSKQEDSHDIWPDSDFANSCLEFSPTKKSYH